MTKQQAIDDPNSVWNRTRPDEPVFVLVGRDTLAWSTVLLWADAYRKSKGIAEGEPLDEKGASALEVSDAMRAWPDRKIPG